MAESTQDICLPLWQQKGQTEGEYFRDRGYRAVLRYGLPQDREAAMRRRHWVKKNWSHKMSRAGGEGGRGRGPAAPATLAAVGSGALAMWLPEAA